MPITPPQHPILDTIPNLGSAEFVEESVSIDPTDNDTGMHRPLRSQSDAEVEEFLLNPEIAIIKLAHRHAQKMQASRLRLLEWKPRYANRHTGTGGTGSCPSG